MTNTSTEHSTEDKLVPLPRNVDLSKPRHDQRYFMNRARYYLSVTNPLNIFATSEELDKAEEVIKKYKNGDPLPQDFTLDDLWHAKNLYDSAYHPDTGERMFILGRMAAQVPANMFIAGAMTTFYKSASAVIFWQWLNQSFNALVNYTNRAGDTKMNNVQIFAAYVLSTAGAFGTGLTLNAMVKQLPYVVGRMVPFISVAAGNAITIPLMRMQELMEGVPIRDVYGHKLGCSVNAAKVGIIQTIHSRNLMFVPPMVIVPALMHYWESYGYLKRHSWYSAPIQICLVGLVLTFATPICCAIFDQHASLSIYDLEPEVQRCVKLHGRLGCNVEVVYFNKGL